MYPVHYTLCPIPFTMYPTPHTLCPYPIPSALYPVPYAHQVGVDAGEEVGRARDVRGLVFQVRGSVRTPPAARVQGSGFRVQGAGFRVQGSGCRLRTPPAARCASTVYAQPNSIVFAFTFLGENLRNPSVFYRESSKRNASLGAFVRVGGNVLPLPRGAPAGFRNVWRPGRQRVKG